RQHLILCIANRFQIQHWCLLQLRLREGSDRVDLNNAGGVIADLKIMEQPEQESERRDTQECERDAELADCPYVDIGGLMADMRRSILVHVPKPLRGAALAAARAAA